MEEDDEVSVAFSSTWKADDGFLERSVCIAREEDEAGTPGPTSRLVLVRPSEDSGPCELTVTFQRRLCHVRQLYVLSTARTVEIYGELEPDTEAEYVSTMRGELVSLADAEILESGRGDEQRSFFDSEKASGENGACQSALLASSGETESKLIQEDAQNGTILETGTEELVGEWKEQVLTSNGSSWGQSRDSEEELFQSLSDGVAGKMVEGSIIFDEPLDQTDWVECPHSPMKNSALSSDDEVDINRCGFLLVDPDGEAQHTEPAGITFLVERMNGFPDHALRSPLEAGDKQAGQQASSELSTGKEEAVVEKGDAACECLCPGKNEQAKNENELAQGPFAEERSQPPTASSSQVVEGSAFQRDNISGPRDVSDVQCPTNLSGIPHRNDLGVSRRACLTDVEDSIGETPVYEAEMDLTSSDPWRSVKVRFLSLKDKSKVVLHKVIIKLVPGPPILPVTKTSGPFGSVQQSAGSSSLLAMLTPGILQMARGLADTRKVNSLGLKLAERNLADSQVSTSPYSLIAGLSGLGSGLPSPQPTPSSGTSSSFAGSVDQKKNDLPPENVASPFAEERYPCVSHSLQNEPCGTGVGLGDESCVPVVHNGSPFHFDQSEMTGSKDIKDVQSGKFEDLGRGKDHILSHEVVQRLDRLEAICLRMENSLNFALETMDRRLKLLEVGGMGKMHVTGQPLWGAGHDSGPFVSVMSVNIPPVQTGIETGSVLDKQSHGSISAPVDAPARQLPEKGVASGTDPFYPGLLSSSSRSLLSSVSPALLLWPLSSPKRVSPESNSRSSSTTTSIHSKDGHVDQLIGSSHGQPVTFKAEETYWEAQTSDDTGSDMSSDSEHTSYADNSEEPDPSSCPESVSSSPSRPAPLVEIALASALAALSAQGFDAAVVNSVKQDYLFPGEDEETAEEDSFTSFEQAPLVDTFCLSFGVQDESAQAKTEEAFILGYEAIPVSVEKETYHVNADELSQEDVFWTSEIQGSDRGSQTNWQEGMLQSEDKKMDFRNEDLDKRVGKNSTASEATPDLLLDTSNVLCMDDLVTYDLFSNDFEKILREESGTESKGGERTEAFEHDNLPNPFLQRAFAGDRDILAREDSWCEDWNDKQREIGDNVTLTYMTVRGFAKPLDPHKEMLLQEELFPEDWNWCTSEVRPSSNETDLPESLLGNVSPKPGVNVAAFGDPPKVENDKPRLSVGYSEPRSLLDEDIALVGNSQLRVDLYSIWGGQETQSSLLDEDPPIGSSVDVRPEEDRPDDWVRQREQRSLLDEDILIPRSDITTGEREGCLSSPSVSPEEQYDLSGVIRPPKCIETVRSPLSQTSRSNPFEDDCNESLDPKLENQYLPTIDLLEDFGGEAHEFEAPESERTQSLLFHLSL